MHIDATEEAPPPRCDPPREICAEACVNVASSPESCGRCGHDCGGGECIAGVCQPVLVADQGAQLAEPTALALNRSAIFWLEPGRVRSCPLPAGCAEGPRSIADGLNLTSSLGVTEDAVYFTACPGCSDHGELLRCPVAGCPEPIPSVAETAGAFDEILVGKTHIYWRDGRDALVRCDPGDCAATKQQTKATTLGGPLLGGDVAGGTVYMKPSGMAIGSELRTCDEQRGCELPPILTNSQSVIPPFRVRDGRAYWLTDGVHGGAVRSCSLTNCGSGTPVAAEEPEGIALAVDDSGVYWLTPAGSLRRCPLGGCRAATPLLLAHDRVNPTLLTLDAGFIYWVEGTTIVKLAKP